jgi:hypothetical protein
MTFLVKINTMTSVAVALDLEFEGDLILCAATSWTNGTLNVPQLWVSHNATGYEPLNNFMIDALIQQLWTYHLQGITLVTWGGTSSDWLKLWKYAKTPEIRKCILEMAHASVDIPLVSAAATGMMMSLTSTAMGMGLGARPACDSEDVPRLWNTKDPAKQNEVVNHVKWDAWACAALWEKLIAQAQFSRPQLCWVTKKSGLRSVRLHRVQNSALVWVLPKVEEVLKWEKPKPQFTIPEHLRTEKLTSWLKEVYAHPHSQYSQSSLFL